MSQLNQKVALESPFLFVKDNLNKNIKLIVSPCSVQIGLMNNPSDLTLTGRLSLSNKVYLFDTNVTSIKIENHVSIAIMKSISATSFNPRPSYFSVFLPSGCREGQTIIVKDFSGIAATIPFRIFDSSGLKIDGADYKDISTQYQSLNFVWSENWFVV